MLKAFGAELILTEGAKGMPGAIAKAAEVAASDPARYFMPQQFENPANPEIHEKTTGPEIWDATDGNIDVLVSGVGTGGTITGLSRYFKNVRGKAIMTVAVEPEGSPVISQALAGEELKPGNLLKMFHEPNFDISLFYRNFGRKELHHWFDPFMDIIMKEFGGGRVVQKTGTAFDPNNPLRKYHGLLKVRLPEGDTNKVVSPKTVSDGRRIRQLTNPNSARRVTRKSTGGRFLALMCIIRHKRKVPTIFYHTSDRTDVPQAKQLLNKISKRLDLEGGLRMQEGRLL